MTTDKANSLPSATGTPRTDALVKIIEARYQVPLWEHERKLADLARQLERELAEKDVMLARLDYDFAAALSSTKATEIADAVYHDKAKDAHDIMYRQGWEAACEAIEARSAPASEKGTVTPQGWKLVPVELTEDMRNSLAASYTLYRHASNRDSRDTQIRNLWSDVLNIAPSAPSATEDTLPQRTTCLRCGADWNNGQVPTKSAPTPAIPGTLADLGWLCGVQASRLEARLEASVDGIGIGETFAVSLIGLLRDCEHRLSNVKEQQ